MTADRPRFSVIVPTFGRPERLACCLQSIDAMHYPRDRFEVIVADDGSPEPVEPAARAAGVAAHLIVLRQPNAGSGAARNLAARAATGDYLAFTADDCTPRPDWLDRFAAAFARDGWDQRLLGGHIDHALPGNICSTASHLLIDYLGRVFNHDPQRPTFFTPNNMAVHTRSFLDAGGFDATIGPTGEDREFCARWLRQGRAMGLVSDAAVSHAHPLTLAGFIRQQYAYGVGSARFRKRLPTPIAAVPEPLAFYAHLVAHPLRAERGARAAALAGLMIISQLANAAGVLRESRRRQP